MRQNQDFTPIEGLTQCDTCINCSMFTDFRDNRSRGWCSAFERIAKTFHPQTNTCQQAIAPVISGIVIKSYNQGA